ncbi:MAG: DUF2934 domain-containing protein [Candidatus Omnitrophota bacterium]|nr:MAG: DUF2934 domain-containing protein [Candidatus Omnitrophota bacterium]
MAILRRIKKRGADRSLKKITPKGMSTKKMSTTKGPQKMNLDESQLRQMIQERAYYIWEERGRPAGQDQDIWNQAQNEIMAMGAK